MPDINPEQFEGEQFNYDVDNPLWEGRPKSVNQAVVERHASTHRIGGRDPIAVGGSGEILALPDPARTWIETDATINNRVWDILANNEALHMRALDDDQATGTAFITVERTGSTIDSVTVQGALGLGAAATSAQRFLLQETTATVIQPAIESTVAAGRIINHINMSAGAGGADLQQRVHGSSYSETLFGLSMADAAALFCTGAARWVIGTLDSAAIIFGTNGTERGQFTAAGVFSLTGLFDLTAAGAGQIKFPSAQNASTNANTLDDYAENSYTPTGNGVTLTDNGSSYVKVGRIVCVQIDVTWPSTANTDPARITLPFTVSGQGSLAIGYSSNANTLMAQPEAGVAYLNMRGLSAAAINNSQVSTDRFRIGGCYIASA